MLKKYLDYEKIKKEYDYGDINWLDEIDREINNITTEDKEEQIEIEKAIDMMSLIYIMNDVKGNIRN